MKMQTLTVNETTTWLETVEDARKSLLELTNWYNGLTNSMFELHRAKYEKSKFKFLFERYDTLEEFMGSELQCWANLGASPPGFMGFSTQRPRYNEKALEFISVYRKLYEEMNELINTLSVRWSVHAMRPFQIESEDIEDFMRVGRYAFILRNALRKYSYVKDALKDDELTLNLQTLIIGRVIKDLNK